MTKSAAPVEPEEIPKARDSKLPAVARFLPILALMRRFDRPFTARAFRAAADVELIGSARTIALKMRSLRLVSIKNAASPVEFQVSLTERGRAVADHAIGLHEALSPPKTGGNGKD